MNIIQNHGRKILIMLIVVSVLFALFGAIVIVTQNSTDTLAKRLQKTSAEKSEDDQMDMTISTNLEDSVSSQAQKVDAPTTVYSRFLERDRFVLVLVVGLLFLAAIVAAVTVGVLYQQGLLNDTDSIAMVDEEEQERLVADEKRRIDDEHAREELQKAIEAARDKQKHGFYIRLGVFAGMLIENLVFGLAAWFQVVDVCRKTKSKAGPSWFVFNAIIAIVMGATGDLAGFIYCSIAITSGIFFLIPIEGLREPPKVDCRLVLDFLCYSIMPVIIIIGPIIHMNVLGAQLWGSSGN